MNSSSTSELKVGIVDDSPLIRQLLHEVISKAPNMRVVGEAEDPIVAREMIKRENPDVITLDIEMPRMNGIEFLEKLMRLRPMPVVMVSTLTQKGADVTLQALEMGALDYIAKPENQNSAQSVLEVFERDLVPKLQQASAANLNVCSTLSNAAEQNNELPTRQSPYEIIGIASSTGGVERLRYLIANMRINIPPIVIVQHINERYVPSMIERNQKIAPPHIVVKAAEDRELLKPNTIYFADNTKHVTVKQLGSKMQACLIDAPPLNGFVASADYLFNSMATMQTQKMAGLILSGMGHDGAEGLLKLKQSGAQTIGENKASCLVYGMSHAAGKLGAIGQEMSIQNIQKFINYEKGAR